MLKKGPWLLLLFVLSTTYTHGQFYAGLQAGFSENHLLTNISNRPTLIYHPGYGVLVSLPVQYNWDFGRSEIAAGLNPTFIQKSYNLDRTNSNLRSFNQHTRNNYLQLPLTGSYIRKMRKMTLAVSGGMYGAYWLSSHIDGGFPNMFSNAASSATAYPYNEKYAFNSIRDNRWEFGWHAGVGAWSARPRKYQRFLKFDFYQGITDLQKKYMLSQVPRYNRTYTLTFGILKRLHKNDDKSEK